MPEGNCPDGKPRLNIFIPKKVTYKGRMLRVKTLSPDRAPDNACQNHSPATKAQSRTTRQAAQNEEQLMPLQASGHATAVTADQCISEAPEEEWTTDQLRLLHKTLTRQLLQAAKCPTGSNISSRADSSTLLHFGNNNQAKQGNLAFNKPGVQPTSKQQPSSSSGSLPTRRSQGMQRHFDRTKQPAAVRTDSAVAREPAVTPSVSATDTASKAAASSPCASNSPSLADFAARSTGDTPAVSASQSSKAESSASDSSPSGVKRTKEVSTLSPQQHSSSDKAVRSVSPRRRSVRQLHRLRTSPAQGERQSVQHSSLHKPHSRSATRRSTSSARQSRSPSKPRQPCHKHNRLSMAYQNASAGHSSPSTRPSRAAANAGEPLKGPGGSPARRPDPQRQGSRSAPRRRHRGGRRIQRRRQILSARKMLESSKNTSHMKPYPRRHAEAGVCSAIQLLLNVTCSTLLCLLDNMNLGNSDGVP